MVYVSSSLFRREVLFQCKVVITLERTSATLHSGVSLQQTHLTVVLLGDIELVGCLAIITGMMKMPADHFCYNVGQNFWSVCLVKFHLD